MSDQSRDRELTISRFVHAPPEQAYDAWFDPAAITLWWGPRGFSTTTHSTDARPGGSWLFTMHGPDGTDFHDRADYVEMNRPSRIVYDLGTDPLEGQFRPLFRATVTIEREGAGARVTMHLLLCSAEALAEAKKFGAVEGGLHTLTRLEEMLVSRNVAAPEDALVLARIVNASRDRVWAAHLEPERLGRWWGPVGFTTEILSFDARPGGEFHYRMIGAEGQIMYAMWRFLEITPKDEFSFLLLFADEQGRPAPCPWDADWPMEMHCRLSFAEVGEHTVITLRKRPWQSSSKGTEVFTNGLNDMRGGWSSTYDSLDGFLRDAWISEIRGRVAPALAEAAAGSSEFTLTRIFRAPCERVFTAWTDPGQLMAWWGPKTYHIPDCVVEQRAGGRFSLLLRSPEGEETPFNGTIREISAPGRIVIDIDSIGHSGEFFANLNRYRAAAPGDRQFTPALSAAFVDLGDEGTRLELRSTFSHTLERDALLHMDAPGAWTESLDKLAALLAR